MKGFFSGKTPKQKIAEGAYKTTAQQDPCVKCGLHKGCKTPRMEMSGEGRLGILAIGEGPGENEDLLGYQFAGQAGNEWQRYLDPYGIDRFRDLYLTNAVNCRPPDNRTPNNTEIACCRGRVMDQIRAVNPKFIWLVGEAAVKSFYGGRFSHTEIGRWRQLCIPDQATGAWVVPMYHPSFALRGSNDLNKTTQFERDIRFAAEALNREAPVFTDPTQYVQHLLGFDEVTQYLMWMLEYADQQPYIMVYDWETSNLKPMYDNMQRIWSCAISLAPDQCVAFPVSYTGHFSTDQQAQILQLLAQVMTHQNIWKVAHNLQFEDLWNRGILGVTTASWYWCTMNAAHIIDCRSNYTGLKFQAYINYGIEGYDADAKGLVGRFHRGTRVNLLDTLPLHKLLNYNGTDAIVTHWLLQDQYPILTNPEDPRTNGYALFHEGLQTLNDATAIGINMENIYYLEMVHTLEEKMEVLMRKLTRGTVAKQFKAKTGKDLQIVNKNFSAGDLRVVLYDILGIPAKKTTSTGLKSVDKEVLETMDHPWTKNLVQWRQLEKILNTYLAQFIREINSDGFMNPFFPLHIPRTYRGSSRNPNFQNIPNREEEAKRITRSGVIPRPGRRLGSVDYGGQEVRVAALLSQDPKLMWYCQQDGADPHMDVTCRIWGTVPELVSGLLRFHSKGGFVFAEIYGSYYLNCAVEMWENCIDLKLKNETPLRQHLVSQGIVSGPDHAKTKLKIRGKTLTVPRHMAQFVDHVKHVEEWFWGEFAGLRDWQLRMVAEYQKYGYVSMPFGFRRGGLLNNNKIFNTAIQGTAFHLLLWAYNRLYRQCKTRWITDQLGQIHDEIVFDMEPSETQDVFDTAEYVMTQQIIEENPWINVPLIIEPEATDIDAAWYYKKEMVRDADGYWVYKEAA